MASWEKIDIFFTVSLCPERKWGNNLIFQPKEEILKTNNLFPDLSREFRIFEIRVYGGLFFLFLQLSRKAISRGPGSRRRKLAYMSYNINSVIFISQDSSALWSMQDKVIKFLPTERIPFQPMVAYDSVRNLFVHLYENTGLDPSTFKEEVTLSLSRKESFSGSVARVFKIQDEHITMRDGSPAMEVTVVSDYIPWRFHLEQGNITYEQALLLLEGSLKGFRELLHKIKTPFLVDRYMIGVDYKGEVRVWWNEHFHRNRFSFKLTSETRLKDMVTSLVSVVTQKMELKDRKILESNLFCGVEVNFVNLENRIKELSKGLSLKVVGKAMVEQISEVALVTSKVNKMSRPLLSCSPMRPSLRSSKVLSTQKSVIIVPDSPAPRKIDRSEDKVITKRIYQNGTAPMTVEKMNIIKGDIEKLREVANEKEGSPTLRQSKSLSSFTSYFRGMHGDETIPQVSRIIKQSMIMGAQRPTVSMFMDPQESRVVKTGINPQKCTICTGVQGMRKSQLQSTRGELQLSRIKSLQNLGSDRDFFSTERSVNDSRLDTSILKDRFGESEKKLPYRTYFGSLVE